METVNKGETRKISNAVSVSNETASRKKSEKQGFIKRFLKWIAKGSDKLRMARDSCPT